MNRGSHPIDQRDHLAGWNFNEAPIHESGKSPLGTSPVRPAAHCSEAPIHESGE